MSDWFQILLPIIFLGVFFFLFMQAAINGVREEFSWQALCAFIFTFIGFWQVNSWILTVFTKYW